MKILFVGDIALGDHPKAVGFGFFSKYKEGISDQVAEHLFPHEISADIIFGNLEFGLSDEEIHGNSIHEVYCRGVKRFTPFLRKAGFSVLNMANNHQYQYGRKPFINTKDNLKSYGIHVCGTSDDFLTENILMVGGQSVAFLGWSDRPRQYFSETPFYNEFDVETSLYEIDRMSKFVDIICVSIHWGEEFVGIPNERERTIARNMIDNGATIVVGHHPHVIREVESYHDGIIAYSLGNFICDMIWNNKTKESGCLCVEVEGSRVLRHLFYPAIIGDDYFPHYFTKEQSIKFLQLKKEEYNKLNKLVTRRSYEYLSRHEMKRHQLFTMGFFLRNMHRYKIRFICDMLSHAIKSRM